MNKTTHLINNTSLKDKRKNVAYQQLKLFEVVVWEMLSNTEFTNYTHTHSFRPEHFLYSRTSSVVLGIYTFLSQVTQMSTSSHQCKPPTNESVEPPFWWWIEIVDEIEQNSSLTFENWQLREPILFTPAKKNQPPSENKMNNIFNRAIVWKNEPAV